MIRSLLLALFSIQNALTGEASLKDQLKYESKTASYSIMLPREWRATADKKIYDPDGHPVIVDLLANAPDRHISLEIIVNHAVAEENTTKKQSELKSISQFIDNYKVEESSEIILDGLPAMRHLITYNDKIEFAKLQYLITYNRLVYEITFTMPKSELEQNKEYVEKIVKSIRFVKNEK